MNITEQEVREVLESVKNAELIRIDNCRGSVHIRRAEGKPMHYAIGMGQVVFRFEDDPRSEIRDSYQDYIDCQSGTDWGDAVEKIISRMVSPKPTDNQESVSEHTDGKMSDAAAIDIPGIAKQINEVVEENKRLVAENESLTEKLGNVDEAEIRTADITQQILGIDAKLSDLLDQKTELSLALIDAKIRESKALSEAQQ